MDEENNEEEVLDVEKIHQDQADSNIKIYLRIRPSKKPSGFFEHDESESRFKYRLPKEVTSGLVNNTRTSYDFRFDGVIGMDATQQEVFDIIGAPCVKNALEGFNSTIFAYGQTGSGKTFTITGGVEKYDDRGIIPRCISMIFNEQEKRIDSQITCYVSYMEIYNERGYDLLNGQDKKSDADELPRVKMMEDDEGNCHLINLSMHRANSEEEALNLLFLGDTNRAVSETAMNLASSRSHCIFTISIENRKPGDAVILRSKLHLVDLAGSERAHKTGAQGQILKEAKFINTSLHFLEMVIVSLHEKATKERMHIPYRNSMLTSVLRDSLGGNCKTAMVATVSAEKDQTDESISTCRFAQRVAKIRNEAHTNEELDPSIIIKRLKGEIVSLKEEIAFLKGETGDGDELNQREMEKLKQKCVDFVNDPDQAGQLGVNGLTFMKINACFKFLKDLVLEAQRQNGNTNSENSKNNSSTGMQLRPHLQQGAAGISTSKKDQELLDEIESLQCLIQQRDNEIAILVNMVKKGQFATGDNMDLTQFGGVEQPWKGFNNEGSKSSATATGKVAPMKKDPFYMMDSIDAETLSSPEAALEAFKKLYPKNDVIQQNKQALKDKYAVAKTAGDMVNEARKNIQRAKLKIEDLRKEKIKYTIYDDDDDERKDSDHDGGRNKELEDLEQRERNVLEEMKEEKIRYKDEFQNLKEQKKEIEKIQKLLETNRLKLQKDFDTWYGSEAIQQRIPNKNQFTSQQQLLYAKVVGDDKIKTSSSSSTSTSSSSSSKQAWASPTAAKSKEANSAAAASAGLGSVGNSSVDEDIDAFFKARDILKQRNSRR